jgi:hypothetical protein
MSNMPHADLHFDREPVLDGLPVDTLVSVVPLSVPGSGVPAAAPCHSRFVQSLDLLQPWGLITGATGGFDRRVFWPFSERRFRRLIPTLSKS